MHRNPYNYKGLRRSPKSERIEDTPYREYAEHFGASGVRPKARQDGGGALAPL
jgi:hypothetical protein